MSDRIGIDTHGLDEPPDAEELSQEQEDRLSQIEQQIADLVGEYEKISGLLPYIHDFVPTRRYEALQRHLKTAEK